MSIAFHAKASALKQPSFTQVQPGLLQRKCACGNTSGIDGFCTECRNRKLGIQSIAAHKASYLQARSTEHENFNPARQLPDAAIHSSREPQRGHNFSKIKVMPADRKEQLQKANEAKNKEKKGSSTKKTVHESTEKKAGKTISKVKKISVQKTGSGFDDFEAKRGSGKTLGYHHGRGVDSSIFANFRFVAIAEVEGDINKCKYEQTLKGEDNFTKYSGDDTYDELKARPLKTDEWVKVDGNKVMWQDAPGMTTEGEVKPSDLPYHFNGDFTQSATGEDGEEVKVAWKLRYVLDKGEKWLKSEDDLDVSKTHS